MAIGRKAGVFSGMADLQQVAGDGILVVGVRQDDVRGRLHFVQGVGDGAGGAGQREHPQVVEAVAENREVVRIPFKVFGVITSYSIHYTKLYEISKQENTQEREYVTPNKLYTTIIFHCVAS